MYPDLFRMIEDHPQIFFQVYTNGTLMTKEKAEQIRDLGNAMVVVSCEGYEEETDRWRGPGVYKKIMEAMDCLREANVLFGSSATVTKNNVGILSSEEEAGAGDDLPGAFAERADGGNRQVFHDDCP